MAFSWRQTMFERLPLVCDNDPHLQHKCVTPCSSSLYWQWYVWGDSDAQKMAAPVQSWASSADLQAKPNTVGNDVSTASSIWIYTHKQSSLLIFSVPPWSCYAGKGLVVLSSIIKWGGNPIKYTLMREKWKCDSTVNISFCCERWIKVLKPHFVAFLTLPAEFKN